MNNHYNVGWLVKSIQGRDKDEIYIIFKVDGDRLYLVNGKNKLFASPKIKNIKHIQPLNYESALTEKIEKNAKIFDAEVYSNIKKYKENI